jgi:phage gpG-like protein
MARARQTITITVSSDAEIGPAVEAAIRQVVQEVAQEIVNLDYQQILGGELVTLEKIHANYFAQERTPTGGRWKPLSPNTVKKKGRSRVLVDSGSLLSSLTTGGGIRRSSNNEIEFGTAVPYAVYHLTGFRVRGRRAKVPPRVFLGLSQGGVDTIAKNIADGIIAKLK